MSEPLYRIWSIQAKKFVGNGQGYCVTSHGRVAFVLYTITDEGQSNYIIQRCTGEKDVNGKYIYEGDIIKYGSMFCGYDKAVIEFGEGQFKLQNLKQNQFENILSTYITVIGNNLENPELLLEKDEK